MEYLQWQAVITDFCALKGLTRPQDLLENGLLNIAGMDTLLEFEPEQLDHLTIRFDVGNIPPQHKASLCEALLMSNFSGAVTNGWVWSLHPQLGRAICNYHLTLPENTSGQDLATALETAALGTQKMWQELQAVFDASLRDLV